MCRRGATWASRSSTSNAWATVERDRALSLIRSTDAVEEAFARAQFWAQKAKLELESLPSSPATNALFAATNHLLDRAQSAS